MQLNDDTTYQPYLLGRIFAVLEEIENKANPGTNSTIKENYFILASETPANYFPKLQKLAEIYLSAFNRNCLVKKHGALMVRLTESYPGYLSLDDQAIFYQGYHHEHHKYCG